MECIFFSAEGSECSLVRAPFTSDFLVNMTSIVNNCDNLKLPPGFTERDLILDRLRFEHPEIPLNASLKLCPEHRYLFSLGYVSRMKRSDRKGEYGSCQWKKHKSGADRLLTYPMRWQMAEKDKEKPLVLGMPVCKRCFSDQIRPHVNEDPEENSKHYITEKVVWDHVENEARNVFRQPQIPSPLGEKRLASGLAEARIREMAEAETPGSPRYGQQRTHTVPESPMYSVKEPQERLVIFNRSMKEIAALANQDWKNVPFLLVRLQTILYLMFHSLNFVNYRKSHWTKWRIEQNGKSEQPQNELV